MNSKNKKISNGVRYPNFKEEKKLWKKGYTYIVGLDEAGRGCERPDAEVLTDSGWKFYYDINLDDKVLSFNEDGFLVWQKIKNVIENKFDGNLVQLKNKGINIVVTPDHCFTVLRRVFKRDKKDSDSLKLVGCIPRKERKKVLELDKNDFIPRGGKWDGTTPKFFKLPGVDKNPYKDIDIEAWGAFLGIFLAEGSVFYDKKKGSYKITISQSRNSSLVKYKRILKLLQQLPFHFNHLRDGFNCYNKQLYCYLKQLGNKYTKFIPSDFKNLNPRLLNILIDWMLLGDGSCYTGKNRKKVSVYYTASAKLRDDFEEILLKAGWTYHTVKRLPKDRYINSRLIKKENQKGCFEIRLRRNNKAHIKSLHKNKIPYKGNVFCLELSVHHNFYVRRDGTGYFTGNSLGGPVVAGAINLKFEIKNLKSILNNKILKQIKDSKKLSAKQRENIYEVLVRHSQIGWGVGIVSEKVIDKINILEATKLAMKKALQQAQNKLGKKIDFLILDGNFKIDFNEAAFAKGYGAPKQKSVIKGDQKVFSVAAASIIAKVTRDRIMEKYHKKYPQYGFDKHKGYGTKAHFASLEKFGPSKIHRKTFYPVSKMITLS